MPPLEILSITEQGFLQTLSAPPRQQSFAWGRWLVRASLSRHTAIPPSAWNITPPGHGRPAILAPTLQEPLFFSLSHCKHRAVCAVATTPFIGIDIEDTHRSVRIAAVARRLFTPDEQALLNTEPEKRGLFFLLWTKRESSAKAFGINIWNTGHTLPFNQPLGCDFYSIKLENRYQLTLCIKMPEK